MRARLSSILACGLLGSSLIGASLVTSGLGGLSGCVNEATSEPCTGDERCLPGFQCVNAACVPCGAEGCETSLITLVSTGGGLACEADGTCLRFPPGALTGTTEIEAVRTTFPVDTLGAPALSKIYVFRPASVLPLAPVEVVFPVSRQLDLGTPVFIRRALDPRGPWEVLPTSRQGTRASAYTDTLAFFALTRETPPPADAGVRADAGMPEGTNPVPGIGAPRALTGPLTTLHGLAWDRSQNRMLFADTMTGAILAFTHTTAIMEPPAAFRSNVANIYGLAADAQGRVLMMELTSRSITASQGGAAATPLVERYQGQRLNGPADAAIRDDGTIYFTDPGTGLALTGAARELQFNGLFRVGPAAGAMPTLEWQAPLTAEPQSVELSADDRTLYVTDSAGGAVLAWDVATDGALSNRRTFALTAAGPDGLAVDSAGNVYVATSAGIEVIAPNGAAWGTIPVPARVGSLGFGGPNLDTLYATTPTALYVMTAMVRGAP